MPWRMERVVGLKGLGFSGLRVLEFRVLGFSVQASEGPHGGLITGRDALVRLWGLFCTYGILAFSGRQSFR